MVVLCHQFCSEYLWKFSRCSQIAEFFFFFWLWWPHGVVCFLQWSVSVGFRWWQQFWGRISSGGKENWHLQFKAIIIGQKRWRAHLRSGRRCFPRWRVLSIWRFWLWMKEKWSRRLSYHFYNSSVQNFLYSDAALMFRWSCRFTSQSVFPPSSYPDCKF